MEKGTVSAIVTTYNYGRFVREAIDSVLSQTTPPSEIIVIDDGSTDDTPAVLARVDNPLVKVVRTKNQGIGAARNEGLRRAAGDFVAFLDADDRWRPQKLEWQTEMMWAEPELAAVFTNFVRFNEDGIFPEDQFAFFPELEATATVPTNDGRGRKFTGDAFCTLVSFFDIPAWVQTMLFRRSAIEGLSFALDSTNDPRLRYGLCEDMHFCLRTFRNGAVGFLGEPLAEVRRHGENATRQASDMPHAKLSALRLLDSNVLTIPQRKALQRRIGRALIEAGMQDASDGRGAAAAEAYVNALGFGGARLSALKNLALLALPRAARTAARA